MKIAYLLNVGAGKESGVLKKIVEQVTVWMERMVHGGQPANRSLERMTHSWERVARSVEWMTRSVERMTHS